MFLLRVGGGRGDLAAAEQQDPGNSCIYVLLATSIKEMVITLGSIAGYLIQCGGTELK